MKSFCIKTNNTDIADYLLNRIEEINFPNLIYSKRNFKIYENVIIHYKGQELEEFYQFLSSLIKEVILKFYEEKIIKQLLNYNYFYFDEYEKNRIIENCFDILSSEEEMQSIEETNIKANNIEKQIDIKKSITEYCKEHKYMILEGFIYFRLKKYFSFLDDLVDRAVNQFIIEKEYTEFINLLHVYVSSKPPEHEILHLIYTNGESILLDKNKNVVSISENIYDAKYLSDISFSSNDFALNTLLTLLPEKIEIHLIDKEDEFIETLKLIFENRVSLCKDCNICKTYRLLNNAKILR